MRGIQYLQNLLVHVKVISRERKNSKNICNS